MSSLSEDVRKALMGPRLGEVARRVREGAPVPGMEHWRGSRADAVIQEKLAAWFRSNDPAVLAGLLERVPDAIGHRAVLMFVYRLQGLAQSVDREEIEGEAWVDDEPEPVPKGTCKAAAELLRDLAAAIVSDVMGAPGWTVQPPKKRRGRPGRTTARRLEAALVLGAYEDVLQYLQGRRAQIKRGRDEPEARWLSRLESIVKQTWEGSGIGTELGSGPPLTDDLLSTPIVESVLPIPQDVITRCVRRAARRAEDGLPFLDYIARCLVGHRWHMHAVNIRHQIQIARKSLK